MRVLQVRRGRPLTSAEQEPHFPALQFHERLDRGRGGPGCIGGVENDHAGATGNTIVNAFGRCSNRREKRAELLRS